MHVFATHSWHYYYETLSFQRWPAIGRDWICLSSNDLPQVLGRLYPNLSLARTPHPEHRGKLKVSIIADLEAADIYIDGKFVGNAPATFSLPAGPHKIEVKGQGGTTWQRELEVLEEGDVKLREVSFLPTPALRKMAFNVPMAHPYQGGLPQ